MNICVYGASSDKIDESYIKSGESFGKKLAKSGHSLIFGGGACGMMGAFARGFYEEKGEIIGIVPEFLNVDGILFDHCTKMLYTGTMRERKQLLESSSDAFIVSPGGIGTYDEFFEILTLKQLCRHDKPIAIFNVNGYFDSLSLMLKRAVDDKFMTQNNTSLFFLSDSEDDIIDYFNNYTQTDFKPENFKDI